MFWCILELGIGWAIARLNDQAEFDFIRQAQRGWSHDRSYFIGGRCAASRDVCLDPGASFDFSNYSADAG